MWQIHSTSQKMEDTFPDNVKVLKDKVKLVKPNDNTVVC